MVASDLLHVTTYIVGFADEVQQGAVAEMIAGARKRLSATPPIPVAISRVGYHPQAVVLIVEPPGALDPILSAVREATNAAGYEGHADIDPWIPHISVAYSHADGPAQPIIDALGRWVPKTELTIKSISLAAQTQVGRSWQWEPIAEVYLTGDQT
jgi:2'-5' RNA ligase